MRGRYLLVLGFAVLCLGGVAGTAFAGDGSILIYSEQETYEVESGDEIEMHVEVSHHGTTYGVGLEHISLVAEYDDDRLSVTDVEYAGWFESEEAQGELRTETVTDQPGIVNATQVLEGTEDGVTATERYVTVTFEVDEDASPGNAAVGLGNSSVTIAGGFPSSIFETNPDVTIQGDEGDSADDSGAPPVPLAVPAAVAFTIALRALARRH